MSTSEPLSPTGLPATYEPTKGRFDELIDETGAVRQHWESVVRTWSTRPTIVRRQTVAERLLVAGCRASSDDREMGMAWGLDPVPYVMVSPGRQIRLCTAHSGARCELDDLYGERRLLLGGVIPTAAIGSRLPTGHGGGPHAASTADARGWCDGAGRWLLLRSHGCWTGCGYADEPHGVVEVVSRAVQNPGSARWPVGSPTRTALSTAHRLGTGPRTILLGRTHSARVRRGVRRPISATTSSSEI
jgi:hypothetical protein